MKISTDKKLCEEYKGKHPVISISLKGINAASYEAAFELTVKTIKGAVEKAGFIKMSDILDADETKEYREILDEIMSEATLFWSLKNLSELLEKHYETKVILLIDEYDVPLAKAFENGYYDKKAGFLKMSDKLDEDEKKEYRAILDENMSEATLFWSLKNLSELLEKHYETKVILLIDEYDVPLAKAFENGYYDKMVFLIRNLLEQTLKTNNSLKFAVMTGCMRISKESIFTGLNNLKVLSITDEHFDEYFGFTDEDVKEMLRYYDREDHYEEMRNWYDGYRFGSTDVYCPWDVLNHCDKIKENAAAFPENYWVHTSSNEAVKKIIQMSGNITTKREIERLLAGEEIVKEIRQELTYQEMYQSVENIWSLLFMTGYLTQRQRLDASHYKLAIPNLEVRDIFKTQIMEYFKEGVAKDGDTLKQLCDALKGGDAEKVERLFEGYLKKTISIQDTFVKKSLKENFYHGILLGILGVKEDWGVFSNRGRVQ